MGARGRETDGGGEEVGEVGGLAGSALAAYIYLQTHAYDLPRELGFIFRFVRITRLARSKAGVKWSIADLVDELVAKHGDKEGLLFVDDGSPGTRSIFLIFVAYSLQQPLQTVR